MGGERLDWDRPRLYLEQAFAVRFEYPLYLGQRLVRRQSAKVR
jgi:hypothetical protein